MSTEVDLKSVRDQIAQWLHIPTEDRDVIDFILAVYVSNRIPGDPLWGMIVDASGGGKTELLRALQKREDAVFLSSLTEKTLISGYRDPKHPKKDPSLLPQLNGKVLIVKDLSPLLSMRRESRNAILGDLRDAYDGFTDQGKGNVGRVHYASKFSLLAATTLAIERADTVDQELGERFVKFRMRSSENGAKVRQAIRNVGRDDELRQQIEKRISEFLDSLPKNGIAPRVPNDFAEPLAVISDFTATARSYVPRDRHHQVQYLPRPEVGTRLGKELAKLFLALAIVRGKDAPGEDELRLVARVAEDSLPPNRLAVLRVLRTANRPLTIAGIATVTHLPWSTAKQTMEDLAVLSIVERVSGDDEKDSAWKLEPKWADALEGLPLLVT